MIGALLLLLGCQLAGELAALLLGLPVPGPVLGALLLGACLASRPEVPAPLGEAAGALLRHLSLLFVPAGVGLVQHGPRLAAEWPALLAALVVSTAAGLAAAALAFRWASRPEAPGATDGDAPLDAPGGPP